MIMVKIYVEFKIDLCLIEANFNLTQCGSHAWKTAMHKYDAGHIQKLSEIGIALSVEKDITRLFKMIVKEAKSICNADAGTLYIVDEKRLHLEFVIVLNDSLGPVTGQAGELKFPDVPLYLNGKPNYSNVSSLVALTGESLNIPDIYQMQNNLPLSHLDFSGTRKYDRKTGYHTKSMLVIPMKNHEGATTGVLQLLNAQDSESGQIIPFSQEDEILVASLASQAAVALNNVQLIRELKDLFYAFIKSIATAIDEKSPYTGGHINRVVELTMMIADAVNADKNGYFKNIHLNEDAREELLIAAWMHDVGKITTPEHIVDKAGKLETIFDRMNLIELRFAWMEEKIKNHYLERRLELMKNSIHKKMDFQAIDRECSDRIQQLRDDFKTIKQASRPWKILDNDTLEQIRQIGEKKYRLGQKTYSVLTRDELENLSIRTGTLTDRERRIIEHHAKMTYRITSQLPFPGHLARVPDYASQHHEKPDGSGYPDGIKGKDLPLQSRILAVADIFDALTARDRPYKKPMSLSRAIEIMQNMKKHNHLDPDIVDIFLDSEIYRAYAEKHLDKNQIDA